MILFSIGYGPDESGKVTLNFGPLSRDGGWRRLNVAVSRARKEMKVFSVLKPAQVDLARIRSDGIEGIKSFLEFAQKGKKSLASIANGKQNISFDAINFIAERIRNMGYDVLVFLVWVQEYIEEFQNYYQWQHILNLNIMELLIIGIKINNHYHIMISECQKKVDSVEICYFTFS